MSESNLRILREGRRSILRDIGNRISVKVFTCCSPYKLSSRDSKRQENRVEVGTKGKDEESKIVSTTYDVDTEFRDHIQFVFDYIQDVHNYLKELELRYPIRKEFLEGSTVTGKARYNIVCWLIGLQDTLKLLTETLQLSVAIMDSTLQNEPALPKEDLKLVAMGSLLLATKFEECKPVEIGMLVEQEDNPHNENDFKQMERFILKSLDFCLARSISIHFVRRYNIVSKSNREQHRYSKYLVDLALADYRVCQVRPSLMAAAAVYMAICTVNRDVDSSFWNQLLIFYSGYNYYDFATLVPRIASLVLSRSRVLASIRRKHPCSKDFLETTRRNGTHYPRKIMLILKELPCAYYAL